ncbi:hypothetical protein GOP47_0030072 [Adiantum capillus-veneris]|nr:hypothetical protein GOP47_0030072 [Adiantum capillus-veneris]
MLWTRTDVATSAIFRGHAISVVGNGVDHAKWLAVGSKIQKRSFGSPIKPLDGLPLLGDRGVRSYFVQRFIPRRDFTCLSLIGIICFISRSQ